MLHYGRGRKCFSGKGGGGGAVGILSQSGERELNMVYQRKLGRKGATGGGGGALLLE